MHSTTDASVTPLLFGRVFTDAIDGLSLAGTNGTLHALKGMEIGKTLYRNGEKVGVVVYASPYSLRDSKNPHFAGSPKAAQFSVIVEAPVNFGINLSANAWDLGDDHQKHSVKILGYHYTEGRAIMSVELIEPASEA